MKVTVLTPEKKVFDGDAVSVKVPGAVGEFEVLNNHAPLVSLLRKGPIQLTFEGGEKKNYSIESGFIEVLNNDIALLVQGLEEK